MKTYNLATNSLNKPLVMLAMAVTRGWLIIVFALMGALLLSVAALMVLPEKWQAQTVIGPVVSDSRYGLGLGGSLTSGLSLLGQASGPEGQRFERLLVLLHSRALAERLEKKYHVLLLIYADRWDKQAGNWKPHLSLTARFRRLMGLPASDNPDIDTLQKYLTAHIEVSLAAPQTQNRLVTFSFKDRAIALEVLDWSIQEADGMIRQTTETDADKQIAYLEGELQRDSVSSVENKSSLSDLLTTTYRSKILLVGGQPYAAEIIDPANAQILPSSPDPQFVLGIGAALGLLLGLAAAWIRTFGFPWTAHPAEEN